jgi:hypothetical protein
VSPVLEDVDVVEGTVFVGVITVDVAPPLLLAAGWHCE